MNNIVKWLIIVAVVALIWLLIPNIVWQYIFFLRIPLLMGILLLTLPLIAIWGLPNLLKNLFVLRGIWQIAFTILGATVAGMAIIFVSNIILKQGPNRFFGSEVKSLTIQVKTIQVQDFPFLTLDWLWLYILVTILALPTIVAVTYLSKQEIGKKIWPGLILGISFSGIFLYLFDLFKDSIQFYNVLNNIAVKLLSFLAKDSTAGYIKNGSLNAVHWEALAFFIVLTVVYLAVFQLYKPRSTTKNEAAALSYVMLLIAIATLFLGSLTFFFDYWRVSVLLFWLVIAGLMYWYFNVDHFFELKEKSQKGPVLDLKQAIDKRLYKNTLVIVCASGGGIQATGWTVQVLTGLQNLLGNSFPKAISLISSVSGGSVGTMYYLNHFTEKGYPPNEELDNIFNRATEDSLDAVGWGLAYPDLWRILGVPIFAPKLSDRGTALEKDWQSEMKQPNETLTDWHQKINDGKLPIPIFNTTLVENGYRFLITPINLSQSFDHQQGKCFDFDGLYPHSDLNVATAARLSASFPYVSPLARDNQNITSYHIADGGYFDNSGFVTGVEALYQLIFQNNTEQKQNNTNPTEKETNKIKRVLVLQINPFPDDSPKTDKYSPLLMTILGPLLTLFKVRDPVLKSRNAMEVDLIEQWEEISQNNSLDFHYYSISFPSKEKLENWRSQQDASYQEKAIEFYNQQGDYEPPLSWKLTQRQKHEIREGWQAIQDSQPIQDLKKLWHEDWQM